MVQADDSDRNQVKAAADEAVRVFGKINVLCNNAGVGGGGNAEDPDFDAWDRAMSVNLGGVVNGVKPLHLLLSKMAKVDISLTLDQLRAWFPIRWEAERI